MLATVWKKRKNANGLFFKSAQCRIEKPSVIMAAWIQNIILTISTKTYLSPTKKVVLGTKSALFLKCCIVCLLESSLKPKFCAHFVIHYSVFWGGTHHTLLQQQLSTYFFWRLLLVVAIFSQFIVSEPSSRLLLPCVSFA